MHTPHRKAGAGVEVLGLTRNSSWTEWTEKAPVVVDKISSEQSWLYDSLNMT